MHATEYNIRDLYLYSTDVVRFSMIVMENIYWAGMQVATTDYFLKIR